MVDKAKKKFSVLKLVKQDQDIEDQMQKLTLEQEGKTYKEEKKEDILQILATNQDSQSFDFNDFKFIKHLGSGASGAVDLVIHQKTNKQYAKKKIMFQDNQTIQKHQTWEVKTLFTSQSPQIVKYYGAYYKDQNIHIVQEFMDKGSLDAVLKKVGKIADVILGEMTLQILEGLSYLHKNLKIIHRDIKPANILLNSEGQVKIADLGICGKIENTIDQRQTWVGTIGYMSPERLKGQPYSNNTDIWSLGLMLLECKTGKNPLSKGNENQALWDVLQQLEEFEFPELPEDTSSKFTDFMKCCLEKDPQKRQTADQLLQHKFIQKFVKKREPIQEGFKQWLQTVE